MKFHNCYHTNHCTLSIQPSKFRHDEALHSLFLFPHYLGIDMLEGQVKESKVMVEESDIKYDESARKLAMVEGDLQRSEDRAEAGV